MARKLRFEYPGALYHILNRGNYRQAIFEEEGARFSFEQTLFETCERCGWILHAYVIMGNHYHLALETPQPNLSEGMRWLQSVFATRFNRLRKENGHIFQGRFKSIVVENPDRLGWLCHYIHLNPVRAGISTIDSLPAYRYGSYHYLWSKSARPSALRVSAFLQTAGALKDTPTGRKKYADYLGWLAEDDAGKKEMRFDQMSKGWAQGTTEFKEALLEQEKEKKSYLPMAVQDAGRMRAVAWSERMRRCLKILGRSIDEATETRKSAPWKIAVAAHMKTRMLCKNRWLFRELNMGSEYAVSRYVSEMLQGERNEAQKLYRRITANIKD